MDRFIVMTASAKMPSSSRGIYRRVAVVETDGVTEPKMISQRARGCVRIVETWERCHVGKTERSAYARALKAATALAADLNQEVDCVGGAA